MENAKGMDVTIGDKAASEDVQNKVKDSLKETLKKQLKDEMDTVGTAGGVLPAVHGKTGVST